MTYKHVAWEGGGDWADASVEYLKVPIGLNLNEVYRKYRAEEPQQGRRYRAFPQYLREEHGAVEDDDIEVSSDEVMFEVL